MKRLFDEIKEIVLDSFFTLALFNTHLIFVLVLFFGLSKDSGEYCDSGVRASQFDLFIGNRCFRFYETEVWNQLLYFLDQPALQFSNFVIRIADSIVNAHSSQSSWLFAIVILASTTTQWFAVGYIIDGFRRKQTLK